MGHGDGQVEMAFAKHQHMPSASPMSLPSPASAAARGAHIGVSASKIRRMELSLRVTALIASISAFTFLLTDKQTNVFKLYTTEIVQQAKYSDTEAVVYTIVALGILAIYSLLHLAKVFIIDYSSIVPESSLAWFLFLSDQVMAYFILSAATAATQVAWFAEQGNSGLGWMKVCNLYDRFCKQIGAGIMRGPCYTAMETVRVQQIPNGDVCSYVKQDVSGLHNSLWRRIP